MVTRRSEEVYSNHSSNQAKFLPKETKYWYKLIRKCSVLSTQILLNTCSTRKRGSLKNINWNQRLYVRLDKDKPAVSTHKLQEDNRVYQLIKTFIQGIFLQPLLISPNLLLLMEPSTIVKVNIHYHVQSYNPLLFSMMTTTFCPSNMKPFLRNCHQSLSRLNKRNFFKETLSSIYKIVSNFNQ